MSSSKLARHPSRKKKTFLFSPLTVDVVVVIIPQALSDSSPFYADWQSADWGRERKTVFSNGGHLGKPGLEEGAAAPLLDSFHDTSNCPFSFQSDVSGAGAPRSSLSRYLKKNIYKFFTIFFWLLCVMCFGKPTRHHLLLLRNLILYCVLCAF